MTCGCVLYTFIFRSSYVTSPTDLIANWKEKPKQSWWFAWSNIWNFFADASNYMVRWLQKSFRNSNIAAQSKCWCVNLQSHEMQMIAKGFAGIIHSSVNVPNSRARSAEDLQEEALSDQLAFLERIQHTTGRTAPVAHLAVPNAGAPVWTTLEHRLLSRPGSAQACDGE